jgi:hypothetical protein
MLKRNSNAQGRRPSAARSDPTPANQKSANLLGIRDQGKATKTTHGNIGFITEFAQGGFGWQPG